MHIFLKIIKDKVKVVASGNEPIYSITSVSKLIKIHTRTLMKYEKLGLIKPFRDPKNNRRLYSNNDVKWITCIAKLVHEDGFSLKSLNYVLSLAPCWMVKGCPEETRKQCQAYHNQSKPCWDIISTVCKPFAGKNSCAECDFYKASRQKKDIMISNIETILSK